MVELQYIGGLLVPVSKNLSKLHARTLVYRQVLVVVSKNPLKLHDGTQLHARILVYRQVLVVVSKNPLKLHDVALRKQLVVECPLPIMTSSNQNNNLFHEGP
jgi:hypothetical protein